MIGDHFDNVFVPNNEDDNSSQAIDSHFFYLKNAYVPGKDPLLLYHSLYLYECVELPPLYVCRDFVCKLRFGEYFRTESNAIVDAVFDLYNVNNESNEKSVALIECKSRTQPFSPSDLLSNLEKSIQFCEKEKLPKCRVHFTICKNASELKSSSKTGSELSSLTKAKLINVYRLSPVKDDGFELVFINFNKETTPHKHPEMISVIINLEELNLQFKKVTQAKLKEIQEKMQK